MIVFIVVPKNSGLKKYKDLALSYLNNENSRILEVRGEDVPYWIELLRGKNAIGLTGEDLYREYILENWETKLQIIKRITWEDNYALFGKPMLCLIGPKNKKLESMPKYLTVCISSKYKNIAKRYLNLLESKGYTFKKIYVKGCVELTCSEGIADLVVDIVYSGSSLKKYGLKIFDKIMGSDFLIIGGKNEKNKRE